MNKNFFTVAHLFKIFFLVGLAAIVHLAYLTSFFLVKDFGVINVITSFLRVKDLGDIINNIYDNNNYDAYIQLLPIITIATFLLADFLQMPNFYRKKNIDIVGQTLYFTILLLLITLSFKDLLLKREFPRSVILCAFFVVLFYVLIWNFICCLISHSIYGNCELVVIGSTTITMNNISNKIYPSLKGLDLNLSKQIKYSDRNAIFAAIRRNSEIFICPDVPEEIKAEIIMKCAQYNTVAYLVPQFYEISLYKSRMINFNDLMVFMLDRLTLTFEQKLIKRCCDIVISILALMLSSPIILISMIIIKIESPGDVLFKQTRVTLGGKEFVIYKLRTMRSDAEAHTGAIISGKNDPRVTKFGKFLRRSKIDELPQFLNVLKGDMSVVGPRAERPCFVDEYNKSVPNYSQRFSVKAGITGLAQVAGNYDTTPQDKLRYDLLYIKNYSLLQDFKIMFMTIKTVFSTHLYNNTFNKLGMNDPHEIDDNVIEE